MVLNCISGVFSTVGRSLRSPFLVLIRIFWGYLFFRAGLGKLMHMDSTVAFFIQLGLPFGAVSAYIVAICELLAGLSFVFGYFTRVFGLIMSVIMIVAFMAAHLDSVISDFNANKIIMETPFTYLYTSLILFIFGPGKWSVDAATGKAK